MLFKKKKKKEAPTTDDAADLKKLAARLQAEQAVEADDAESEDTEAAKSEEQEDEAAASRIITALKNITREEDEDPEEATPISLKTILGGDILGGRWFRHNIIYILMVVVMLIIYIGNRYAYQREMLTSKTLSDTLLDRRYKALTRSSQLKERTRRSNIEENLQDSTLHTPNTPPFNLKVGD